MDKWDEAAHKFAQKKHKVIAWITYAGYTPEEVSQENNEPYRDWEKIGRAHV